MASPKPAMYHMLKSMGIDVEEVERAAKQLPLIAEALTNRIISMDAKLDRILLQLEGPRVIDQPKQLERSVGSD
jgi:hypothetical protein